MKKTPAFLMLAATAGAFGFNWPQADIVQSDAFYSYFGQRRGNTISSSLIFSEPSEIKAAEAGQTAVIIREYDEDTAFFPSALGNAVILSHSDTILTVYANIDSETIAKNADEIEMVAAGTALGMSGNSAWQQGRSSLEFQVIDCANNTAINPRIMMPRIGKELPLFSSGIQVMNRYGKLIETARNTSVPAGIYRVYQKRQSAAVPYKTMLTVNGTLLDSISYDVLRQDGTELCVSGRKNYPPAVLYPTDSLILVGELSVSPGYNTVMITLADILGAEAETSFTLNAY